MNLSNNLLISTYSNLQRCEVKYLRYDNPYVKQIVSQYCCEVMFASIFREQFPLNLLLSVTLPMMGLFDNFQSVISVVDLCVCNFVACFL